jgi:hypothetical protein
MERVRASIDNWPQRLKDCIAANGPLRISFIYF